MKKRILIIGIIAVIILVIGGIVGCVALSNSKTEHTATYDNDNVPAPEVDKDTTKNEATENKEDVTDTNIANENIDTPVTNVEEKKEEVVADTSTTNAANTNTTTSNSTTKKSTTSSSSNKTNTSTSTNKKSSGSTSNSSNKNATKPGTTVTSEQHYGGEIYHGINGGSSAYWTYGHVDMNIDTSGWSIGN